MNVVGAWFALIALYTVVTNAPAVSGALGVVGTVLQRIGDPSVPLIPDGSSRKPGTVNPVPLQTNH